MNLFRRKPVSIQIVKRFSNEITLEEWRSDKSLCVQARNALESHPVSLMLGVLRNEHPVNTIISSGDLAERAIYQARCEGYTMAIKALELMAVHNPDRIEIEATFEEETKDQ